MPLIVFAGPMELAQRALEILNLALVVDLLALGKFQCFQHLFHFFERMFQFLNDAVDLVNGLGNRRLLVLLLRLRMVPPVSVFNAFMAFRPLGAFGSITAFTPFRTFAAFNLLRLLNIFSVFALFSMLSVFVGRRWHRFRRGFACHFLVLGLRGCGRIAGGGQGTTDIAAPGMASASASGSAPATRGGRIGLFGCALVCFVWRHKDRLPRGS
jgi:hypothetical protein